MMTRGRRRAWRSRHRIQLGSVWIAVLAVLLAAAVLFTGAVILGNYLRAQAENIGSDAPPEPEITLSDFDASAVPAVIARAVRFGDAPGALGEAADGKSFNAYCAVMRGSDGKLRYRSEFESYLYGSESSGELPTLAEGLAKLGGTYVSGVFAATYPSADKKIRESVRGYELSLAAEIAASGIDDIVITGLSFDSGAADFCREVKERAAESAGAADVKVGIAVGYSFITSDGAREELVRLAPSFDFIALDLSDEISFGSAAEKLNGITPLIGIYRMRIMIPCSDGSAAAALDAGAENIAEIDGTQETDIPETTDNVETGATTP